MFIEFNEVRNRTNRIEAIGEGDFLVSTSVQRAMLGAFLNVAQGSLAVGMPASALPEIRVTYTKVTNTRRRIAGQDFRGSPAVRFDTHVGRPVTIRRNKNGDPFFTLVDSNRIDRLGEPALTSIRLEGVRSFEFADPKVQAAFEAQARALVQAGAR